MNNIIYKIQQRLLAMGYQPGPLDGVFGRKTSAAIKEFQRKHNLPPTGQPDNTTVSMILESKTELPIIPWVEELYRVYGLHEVYNKKSLLDWLKLGNRYLGDPAKNPWCGWAIQTAIAVTLPQEPIPTNPFLALNWTKFGKPVEPQYGSVLVFWRGSPDSWKGHVGFYVGETKDKYLVLGGNQSNRITESLIHKYRLRKNGSRWPVTGPEPTGYRRYVDSRGRATTTNEA